MNLFHATPHLPARDLVTIHKPDRCSRDFPSATPPDNGNHQNRFLFASNSCIANGGPRHLQAETKIRNKKPTEFTPTVNPSNNGVTFPIRAVTPDCCDSTTRTSNSRADKFSVS